MINRSLHLLMVLFIVCLLVKAAFAEEAFGIWIKTENYAVDFHPGDTIELENSPKSGYTCDYYLISPSGTNETLATGEPCGNVGYSYQFKTDDHLNEFGTWTLRIDDYYDGVRQHIMSYGFTYTEKPFSYNNIEVYVEPESQTGHAGERLEYTVHFSNDNSAEGYDDFYLGVYITADRFYTDWTIEAPDTVNMPLEGNSTLKIYITPPDSAVAGRKYTVNIGLNLEDDDTYNPKAEGYYIVAASETTTTTQETTTTTTSTTTPIETTSTTPTTVPEEHETGEEEEASEECEDGCIVEERCIPYGFRKGGEYCDLDSEMKEQSDGGIECENSFECNSNTCSGGSCISMNLIQKIIRWFMTIFGLS